MRADAENIKIELLRKGKVIHMKAMNEMKLIFPSRSATKSCAFGGSFVYIPARPGVDDLSASTPPFRRRLPTALLRLSRRHRNNNHRRLYQSGRVVIKVRDKGVGIEDVKQAMEPLFTTEVGEVGLGFSVMESFTDKLRVVSVKGKGTVVTREIHSTRQRQEAVLSKRDDVICKIRLVHSCARRFIGRGIEYDDLSGRLHGAG